MSSQLVVYTPAEAREESKDVLLGFIEPQLHPRALLRHRFPSKIGGLPAWLHSHLPDTSCGYCRAPMKFLLQIYAPGEEENPHVFHRVLYMFVCEDGSCHAHSGGIRVFRGQLPLHNKWYPSTPAAALEESAENSKCSYAFDAEFSDVNQCCVCGARSTKRCGKCRSAQYCSRAHQLRHWRIGHSSDCSGAEAAIRTLLFPQNEIVIEHEDDCREDLEGLDHEVGLLKKFKKQWNSYSSSERESLDTTLSNEMEQMSFRDIDGNDGDPVFQNFQRVIQQSPDQCIRYSLGGVPLPVYTSVDMPREAPACKGCGGDRVFEFQVLPQLLYFLRQDEKNGRGIDWGTLLVYTCKANCGDSSGYYEEFVWRQSPPMI